MARNHLRFSVDAWRDDDWLALSREAQWLFMAILSQSRMTLVGSLDVNVMRWAGLSADGTQDETQSALDELEDRRFVVIDCRTGELVVRSFTKNDLIPARLSQQIAKGFWSAWKGIASADLRQVVVDNCPDAVWDKVERFAPDDALQNRRSAPIDREPPPPIDRDSHSQSIDPIDNPPSCSPHPESSSQQPAAESAAADEDLTRQRTDLFHAAVDVLVRRAMSRNPARTNRHGYEHALREGKRDDHREHVFEILEAWGDDFTPDELADWLEPPPAAPQPSLRLVERERCRTCNDTTWLDAELNDDGSWGASKPCPDCKGAASA